jgi:energy-coupling factor transporter ATP-binding protein EcfA2
MFIKQLKIKDFKSFKDVTIHFNKDLNILTGKNNSGKTTVLEALSLWHECFGKLLIQAKRGEKNYRKGDWILGPTNNKYFPFDQINSVRSPNFEDIFHQLDKRNKIFLQATLTKPEYDDLHIGFFIGQSGLNYVIELDGFTRYNFESFNHFFDSFPTPIGLFYASPVSAIKQLEDFATDPQIKEAILRRESATVLRNRLYKLLRGANVSEYGEFQNDLSYVLFNNETSIEMGSPSNIAQDTRVVVNFKVGARDTEKDIALLGSGSLQAIEILLNLYQLGENQKDFNLILLDEPDSHIHRDIQQRLFNVLVKFSSNRNNQVFLTTHNESLIRSADYYQLFHLDGNPTSEIKSIDKAQVGNIQPHFKGIFPSQINPIIRSIGSVTGLDFVNAMEADRLIFVEGEDDARIINILLRQQIANKKKYMFWVLGGISEVFENIAAYKQVFSTIKNNKTLWEKSVLVFDKDYITDEHKTVLLRKFEEKIGILSFSWNSYTLESTVFTDIEALAGLLIIWVKQKTGNTIDKQALTISLNNEYQSIKPILEQRFGDRFIQDCSYRYRKLRDQTNKLFGKPSAIPHEDIQIPQVVKAYFQQCLDSRDYFKLMTKDDVGLVIDKVVHPHDLSFSVETDFVELIKLVNKSLWFDEWNFINSL